jgi:hypothetical protein
MACSLIAQCVPEMVSSLPWKWKKDGEKEKKNQTYEMKTQRTSEIQTEKMMKTQGTRQMQLKKIRKLIKKREMRADEQTRSKSEQ